MLSYIAEKCAGLLLDCRAPTRLRLNTLWQQDFVYSGAAARISAFYAGVPSSSGLRWMRCCGIDIADLKPSGRERDISRRFKPQDFARQIAVASHRVAVLPSHPLAADHPIASGLGTRVIHALTFSTQPESLFCLVWHAVEFLDFLSDVTAHLTRKAWEHDEPQTQRLLRESGRLRGTLELQLARGFFPDVSAPTVLPLGSPVLQHKAGYRELLRFWWQFHAGAQLAWDGGSDVFEAGARNVATLYEYWLFFQLEALFRQRFSCQQPLHALVVSRETVPPQLVLKRGVELRTPIAGVWSKTAGRRLRAEFHFNRKFTPRGRERQAGKLDPRARRITPSASGRQTTLSSKRNKTSSWCTYISMRSIAERGPQMLEHSSDDEVFNNNTERRIMCQPQPNTRTF